MQCAVVLPASVPAAVPTNAAAINSGMDTQNQPYPRHQRVASSVGILMEHFLLVYGNVVRRYKIRYVDTRYGY